MRLASWLSGLKTRTSSFAAPNLRRARRTPVASQIHELESRTLLAAVLWDGGGGDFNWTNALNWNNTGSIDPNTLPGIDDDGTIDFGANAFTVTYS